MKKRWSSLGIIMLSTIMLSGCMPTEMRTERESMKKEENNNRKNSLPERIEKKIGENFEINADIKAKKTVGLKSLKGTIQKFDNEKTAKLLFGKEKYQKNNQMKSGGGNGKYYLGKDGSQLNISPGIIQYDSSTYMKKEYSWIVQGFIENSSDSELQKSFSKERLDDLNKEDVEKKADDIIHKLELEDMRKERVVTLDAESLQKAAESNMFSGVRQEKNKEGFEKEDEAYLISYRRDFESVPLTNISYTKTMEDAVPMMGTSVTIIIGKKGLLSLYCSTAYHIEEESPKEEEGVGFDDILNRLSEKYKDLILDSPVEVYEVELAYVPTERDEQRENFKFEPYWIFKAKQKLVSSKDNGKLVSEDEDYYDVYMSYKDGKSLEVAQ